MANIANRILFFGTPQFGAQTLEALYTYGFNVAGVITQPDRGSGRGNVLIPSAVKKTAAKYKILLFQPSSKDELLGIVKQINPEISVISAFGNIIPKDILDYPTFGSLNIHGSLLPKYRGPSPIATAILNGDSTTGVTIIKMTERMDEGPIVSQVKIPVDPDETTESLYQKLAQIGGDEICRVLPLYINGQVTLRDQVEAEATYCSLIKKEDGRINWSRRAGDIERTVRAFIPWPNAFAFWGDKMIKILDAKVAEKALDPGFVVALSRSFLIGCGQDSLEVTRVQLEGKDPMEVKEFLNGNRGIDGATLR
jgi:methionyl-tRNA formyltransferase